MSDAGPTSVGDGVDDGRVRRGQGQFPDPRGPERPLRPRLLEVVELYHVCFLQLLAEEYWAVRIKK